MTDLATIVDTARGTWRLAPDRSTVSFQNKTAWGLATVTGRFTDLGGDGVVADDVTGRLVIGAASLQTGIGRRDKHLRSVDFFDVDTHPEIIVEVTGAEPSPTALLHTTLTVRGTSRPIELPVDVRVLDSTSVQVSGHCTVNRAEFGVNGNMLGMVGQLTDLSANLVFTRTA